MKKLAGVLVALMLGGCSQVTSQIQSVVSNDLARTSELAAKYGKPEVKQCADFLNGALSSQDSVQAKLDELLAEKTDGLLSAALKAALVTELVKGLNDPATQAKFEKDFDKNCKALAGEIFLTLVRDARKGLLRKP